MDTEASLRLPTYADSSPHLSHVLYIDDEKLRSLASALASTALTTPNWRLPVYPQDDDDRFVQFIGVQNALNFCFFNPEVGSKFYVDYQDQIWGGATALCAALLRALDSGIDILDSAVLANLSMKDANQIFAPYGAPLPMLSERVALLNSLKPSLAPYEGSFANVIRASDYDAVQTIERLVAFPAYGTDRDLWPRSHEPIAFDKRARLFTIIYEGRARDSETLPTLSSVDQIGPAVDYQLPRYLRSEGVLVYGTDLAAKVDSQTLIAPGSEEELVLRSATGEVCRLLVDEINAKRTSPISMVELDFAMWVGGRQAKGNHHLTLTTAY